MNKSFPYKYINLLLQFIVGAIAVWYIYSKLNSNFVERIELLKNEHIDFNSIFLVVFLLFVNWGLEALKWKFAIYKVQKITFFRAYRLTFTGVTVGLLTPNRIGEIPARALLLNSKYFKEITLKTMVSSFSQVVITFLLGGIGLLFTRNYFFKNLNFSIFLVLFFIAISFLLLLYFRINKLIPLLNRVKYLRKFKLFQALMDFSFIDLMKLLALSFLRYFVFFFQYWLMLKAFGVELYTINEIFLIPVCFLVASSVPTILISEIGVRGTVALFVFGFVSEFDLQIVLASFLLWAINVSVPALLGLFNLHELKLLRRN